MPASVAPLHPVQASRPAASLVSTALSVPSPPSAVPHTPQHSMHSAPQGHGAPAPTVVAMSATAPAMPAEQSQSQSQLQSQPLFTFTQGVLLGQASMIILAALFLKFVVFEDPDAAKRAREERRRLRAEARGEAELEEDGAARKGKGKRGGKGHKGGKGKASARTPPDFPAATLSAAALLGSLSYDLSTHAPESLDWLNVLSAQLISSYRSLAASHASGGARALVEEALNRRTGGTEEGAEAAQGMIGLDFVEVDEVELGEGYPALSDARVRPSGVGGESVRVELDVDYIDTVVLSVSTRVVLNLPRPRFAVLPISLSLTLERFSGTLTVELPPPSLAPAHPPSSSAEPHHHQHAHPSVHLSLHPDFELQLATSSLLGSRAKLQDVPKIEQLLVARIRAAIQDRVVWPGRVEVALPGLSRDKSHHHHHARQSTHAEAHAHEATAVPPLADDLASSPLRTTPLSPISSPLDDDHARGTPPSLSSLNPSPPLPRPLRNPLLSRTATSSTTGTGTGSGADTPSVDLSAPDGPSIALHPRVRPPPAHAQRGGLRAGSSGTDSPAPSPSPSPSESLPGYFPPLHGQGRAGTAGTSKGLGAGAQGMRYRGGAGPVGVGIGVGR